MFDQEHLATLWHETTLIKAIKGLILPAVIGPSTRAGAGPARARGRPGTAPVPLCAAVHRKGSARQKAQQRVHPGGAALWKHTASGVQRQERSCADRAGHQDFYWLRQRGVGSLEPDSQGGSAPAKPLTHSTVQKRLTALIRLIGFAASELPEGTELRCRTWLRTRSTAAGRCRLRTPIRASAWPAIRIGRRAACRYPGKRFGAMLQAQDETGCRLGELLHARGNQVTAFVDASGQLFGGKLHLPTHKTFDKTGKARDVPLSLRAPPSCLPARRSAGMACCSQTWAALTPSASGSTARAPRPA